MISENNHIIYSAEDIQRYWKGQLSPQEMHAMEKAALDDPFLADAMEGYGLALQEHDSTTLNAQLDQARLQLQSATDGAVHTAPVRSFRWWQVAAAAFVLVVAGYWIFSYSSFDSKEATALSKKESKGNVSDIATVPDSGVRYRAEAANNAPAPVADSVEITAGAGAFRATEPGLDKFNTTTPHKNPDNAVAARSKSKKERAYKADDQPAPLAVNKQAKPQDLYERHKATVQSTSLPDTVRKMETEVIKVQETFAEADKIGGKVNDKEPRLQNIVSGIVTDNKNNPLPNVYLRIDNKDSYTTDPLGNFKIPVSDSVVNVSASLQGYATQNFQLRSTHNGMGSIADNQIRLQSNDELMARQNAINGFDKKKGKFDTERAFIKLTEQDAQPVYGWLTYEQYLEKNKRIPASNPNLKGEVAVSFEVNKKGERSAYKIEKSLSADHDIEAMRLVREGPEWKLNKGRKSRVTVIVRF
jgi:hypothetical protein